MKPPIRKEARQCDCCTLTVLCSTWLVIGTSLTTLGVIWNPLRNLPAMFLDPYDMEFIRIVSRLQFSSWSCDLLFYTHTGKNIYNYIYNYINIYIYIDPKKDGTVELYIYLCDIYIGIFYLFVRYTFILYIYILICVYIYIHLERDSNRRPFSLFGDYIFTWPNFRAIATSAIWIVWSISSELSLGNSNLAPGIPSPKTGSGGKKYRTLLSLPN